MSSPPLPVARVLRPAFARLRFLRSAWRRWFLWVLLAGGWSWGADVSPGSPLRGLYEQATTMAFAGIVVCQVGTAMAARTDRVSLFRIGFGSNRLLLAGMAFELLVAAAAIYLPPANALLNTVPLAPGQLAVLTVFPQQRLDSGAETGCPGTKSADGHG